MAYVRFKPGVKFDPIAPAAATILWALYEVANDLQRDIVVSCGSESHTAPSRHVAGEAVDLSVAGWDSPLVLELRNKLIAKLGPTFFVSIEARAPFLDPVLRPYITLNAAATALHIHIQPVKGSVYPPMAVNKEAQV